MNRLILRAISLTLLVTLCVPFHSSFRRSTSNLVFASHDNIVEIRDVKGLQEGMRMRRLTNTDIVVSEICLGTMTYGEQLTKDQSFEQLDLATKEYGINFIDTAESYPVPSCPSTSGMTDMILGQWLKRNRRQDIVISAKVCGFSDEITWCRKNGMGTRVDKDQVTEAVDGILRRLGTDYIDILHIHWPDRYVPLFGAPEYLTELERGDATSIHAQLEIMDSLVKSGKIRNFGLSNETPYGLTKFLTIAEMSGLARPVCVQNCYNLLVRYDFENGMQEVCSPVNGNVGLLAYSPLAGGALSGKYLDPRHVDNSARMRQFVGFMHRYISPPATEAVRAYKAVADSISLPLAPLALAWVFSRPFVTSTIIGATSPKQLKENVFALNMLVNDEVAGLINDVYRSHLDPTKGLFDVIDPYLETIDPAKLPWGAKDTDVDPELDIVISQRMSKF